ncbi:hypothetical protein [Streptomyces mirabilis]
MREAGAQYIAALLCAVTVGAAGALRTAWLRRRQRREQSSAFDADE